MDTNLRKAIEICIMFLTNTNTITAEKQSELIELLKLTDMTDEADAIAIGGFASVFTESEQ